MGIIPHHSVRGSDPLSAHRRLLGIEAARGLAAILIVLHHAGSLLRQGRYGGSNPFAGLLGEFHVGVDFFFVLSGFIIAYVHWGDLGQPRRLVSYAVRRFTRIYPAYWAILIPLALANILLRAERPDAVIGWQHFIVSLLLVPAPGELVLGVAWTLVYEICFYALFGVLIACGKKALVLLPLWVCAILVWSLMPQGNYYAGFFLNPINLDFLFGIVAAMYVRFYKVPAPWWLLAVGVTVFIGAMLGRVGLILIDYQLACRLVFGLSAMLTVAALVELERSGRLKVDHRLQIFGAASYSIYLIHPVAESALLFITWRFVKGVPADIICVGLAIFGIVAGLVFHRLIERGVIRLARHLLEPKRDPLSPSALL